MRSNASRSSSAVCSARRTSTWPSAVASVGVVRLTSSLPTRSSSALIRCDTAEAVTFNASAARSKLPSRITAASARNWAWSMRMIKLC